MVFVNSEEDSEKGNSDDSHNDEPDVILLLVSGSVDPTDIPEVVATDRDEASSDESQETEVGQGEQIISVNTTQQTTTVGVEAEGVGTSGWWIFPVSKWSLATSRSSVFSWAAVVF